MNKLDYILGGTDACQYVRDLEVDLENADDRIAQLEVERDSFERVADNEAARMSALKSRVMAALQEIGR